MMNKFEYQGCWWLPDNPKEKVPGTLKFDSNEGATLDLMGSLRGLEGVTVPLEPELILGLSSNGRLITLKDCIRTEGTVSMPGFATSFFDADTVFVGEHFERPEDVGFERLIVEYLHLGVWAGVSGFEIIDDLESRSRMVIHRLPEHLTTTVRDEYEVTLYFASTRHGSPHAPVTEITITQLAELVIKFPERKPLRHLMDISFHLQHLLSFGTRMSVYPVAVWGATGPVDEAARVEIYYRALGRTSLSTEKPFPSDMLFTLCDLPEGFGPAVKMWLERAEVLEPVYRLYLGTIYNPQSYIEQRFLNLVQALEVYHRRAINTSDLPEEEHKRRKEEILEAVPNQHRDWLKEKLQYSNEPKLSKRLKEISNKYPESVDLVVGSSKRERKSFINRVVATRHYRTHFDESKKAQAAQGEELYRMTQKLKLLIEICLLREIGFEAEKIKELIK